MTFLPKALRLTDKQMVDKILSTKFPNPNYLPKFCVAHNTGIPNMVQWEKYTTSQRQAYGDNLNHYYKTLGWHSGPHALGTPEGWAVQLCDFSTDGVHASCFNRVGNGWSWGVETIGSFCTGGDDPDSPLGKASIDSTINILAAMHLLMNWNPADYQLGVKGLHFHLECKNDHHACPGDRIHKPQIIERIQKRMTEIKNEQKPAVVENTNKITILPWPPKSQYGWFYNNMERYYNSLLKLFEDFENKEAIAAGITANAEAECSFKIVIGDKQSGGAFGYGQWHSDRADRILQKAKIDVKTAGPEDQAKAVWWEINNTEIKTLDMLRTAHTPKEAAQLFCQYFERAGSPGAKEKRGLMADRTAAYFKKD